MSLSKKQRKIKLLTEYEAENKNRRESGHPMIINLKAFKSYRAIQRAKQLKAKPANRSRRSSFYGTREWKELRYATLVKSEGRCLACGASAKDGAMLRVDHIKSISRYPELKADPNNLQVLCNDCNWGKGGGDQTDWRYGELFVISNNGRSAA